MAGGWLKAIDFGCTQAVIQRPLARRTGTPVFMAPEVRAPRVTVCGCLPPYFSRMCCSILRCTLRFAVPLELCVAPAADPVEPKSACRCLSASTPMRRTCGRWASRCTCCWLAASRSGAYSSCCTATADAERIVCLRGESGGTLHVACRPVLFRERNVRP